MLLSETLKELAQGESGEIVMSGPQIFKGYWKRPDATASAFFERDGKLFFRSGDMGRIDEEGYFFLSGRATDMIIRGGENISPEEVEAVLHSHSKVDEAAVIGVPDEEWGEVPMAVIALKGGETATAEELMEHCRALLASYKRPRSVVFVDELPRNPMGKVLKRVLREQYGKA